ncbi:MAG TPA: CvpA family protein [Verrucomicrobiae bacterium]|nr:CvpA family protein [Verrucomicrobiae bacterium]
MTIWILAVVLLAASIALGHKLGAINAAFTFVGIVFGGLLATTLGKVFTHLLPHLGVHTETTIWAISPIVAFLVVLVLFKMAGFFVHRKIEVYYKYKAGDLRQALWARLNTRLGACIGTLNGTAYIVLISFLIFNFSYWTFQVAPSDDESRSTKLVNRLGNDLQSTGLDKAARALVTMPDNFYKIADLAGTICQNPQLSDRLGRYPAFISLAERDDLQQLAQSGDFTNAWNSRAPMGQLLNDPQVKTILQNNDLLDTVWATVQTNLDDLTVYLQTGKSAKYDAEKILGRWDFNVSTTVAMLRQAQPNIPASEMRAVRALWTRSFADTTFVADADGQAFLKNLPDFKKQPSTPETWKGSWTASDTNYDLSLSSNGENKSMTAQISNGRLTLKDDKNTLIFDRED